MSFERFQARILRDNADNSGLKKGQIVTIVGKAIEAGTNRPYFVAIGVGRGDLVYPIRLFTDSVEHASVAHPDEGFAADAEERDEFEEMIDLDPVLRRYAGKTRAEVAGMLDARDALPAAPPQEPSEAPLPPSAPVDGVGLLEAPREPEEGDGAPELLESMTVQDQDGDEVAFGIIAQTCPEHGPEVWIRVQTTNGHGVDLHLSTLGEIVAFFNRAVETQNEQERGSEGS